MKQVLVLTGTRAEYGLLKPVMTAIHNHNELELLIVATGMHLSKKHGYSYNEIINDGFTNVDKVDMMPKDDSVREMASSIGRGIINLSEVLQKRNPDIVVVLGDRTEALACAIAAAYMNIPLAHIHGGDSAKSGLDECARHSITKFANIHFPVTKKSGDRLIKMGEDKWRIHVVGAPGLDTILNEKLLSKEECANTFNINFDKPVMLMIQHSVTTEVDDAEKQIVNTLEVVKELRYRTIIIYPNSDAGGEKIINKIKEYEKYDFITAYTNLPHKKYLSLLKYVDVLIGNSSSGIIESSSFKVPVVDIGTRQEGRERSTNVISSSYEKKAILSAIKEALSDEFKIILKNCVNPYGEGQAGIKIADILANIKINKELIQKKLAY